MNLMLNCCINNCFSFTPSRPISLRSWCGVSSAVSVAARLDVNVALKRPAYQVSTFTSKRTGVRFYASLANDGIKKKSLGAGSCMHTNEHPKPWWGVDLGLALYVASVNFTNRSMYGKYLPRHASRLSDKALQKPAGLMLNGCINCFSSARLTCLFTVASRQGNCPPHRLYILACQKIFVSSENFLSEIQNSGLKFPLWENFVPNFSAHVISSVENLQLSVGKLRLSAPPTFITHDAAGLDRSYGQSEMQHTLSVYL